MLVDTQHPRVVSTKSNIFRKESRAVKKFFTNKKNAVLAKILLKYLNANYLKLESSRK
jgi:hypothetical protein